MKRFSPPFWAAVQTDYCSGARSVREIARYYKVAEGTVYKHRKQGGWTRSDKALPAIALTVPDLEGEDSADLSGRARLAPRLTKLLERTVAEIELDAADATKTLTTMDRARDVRTLATVMRLLSELERPEANGENADHMTEAEKDEEFFRQEISERLGRLQEQGRTC